MTRRIYNLYVDESGSFTQPGQASVVCGVLEDTSADIDWGTVRQQLDRALPLFDFPLHASVLNSPSAWLAAVLHKPSAAPDATARERALRDACEVARRLIEAEPAGKAPELEEFRSCVAEGRFPPPNSRQVDGWLNRRHPGCFQQLSEIVEKCRIHLQDTFRRLFHPYRHGQLVGLAALARAPIDPREATFCSAAPQGLRLDSYVLALETLLERVQCLLQGSGSCRVDVWPATRNVHLRGFGGVDLSREALQQIIARVQSFPRRAGSAESSVFFTPARAVVRYDQSAPVGLVLADFLSNCTFRMLSSHTASSLAEVCDRVTQKVSLSLLAAPSDPAAVTTLPTLCADGPARERIREAYLGRAASGQGIDPYWNREQASRWIDFASREESAS